VQFAVLSLQRFDPFALFVCWVRPQALIAFRLPHPAAQRPRRRPIFGAIEPIAARCEPEQFEVTQAKAETTIEPDGMLDDLR